MRVFHKETASNNLCLLVYLVIYESGQASLEHLLLSRYPTQTVESINPESIIASETSIERPSQLEIMTSKPGGRTIGLSIPGRHVRSTRVCPTPRNGWRVTVTIEIMSPLPRTTALKMC